MKHAHRAKFMRESTESHRLIKYNVIHQTFLVLKRTFYEVDRTTRLSAIDNKKYIAATISW